VAGVLLNSDSEKVLKNLFGLILYPSIFIALNIEKIALPFSSLKSHSDLPHNMVFYTRLIK